MASFSNTFRVAEPETVQTFASTTSAPYGNPVGYQPNLSRPIVMPEGKQPTYVLKIDITPVNAQPTENRAPIPYSVTGSEGEMGDGRQIVLPVCDQDGVITHTVPQVRSIGTTAAKSSMLHIQPEYGLSSTGVPRAITGIYPENRYSTGALPPGDLIAESRAFEGATATTEDFPNGPPVDGFVDDGGAGAVASGLAFSRRLTHPLPEFESEPKDKLYNWISAAGDEVVHEETPLPPPKPKLEKKKRRGKKNRHHLPPEELPWPARICMKKVRSYSDIDAEEEWKSVGGDLIEGIEERKAAIDVYELSDSEGYEGAQVKPSVIYGGAEAEPPKYCGKLPSKNWKLHAIEIHQYVPIPGVPDPKFMTMGLNPSTDPLYGAIPLPFDPENTGMTAITIQDIMHGRNAPRLAGAMTTLFNQEVPAIFLPGPRGQPGELVTAQTAAT